MGSDRVPTTRVRQQNAGTFKFVRGIIRLVGPDCIQFFKFVREIIRLVVPHCMQRFKFVRGIKKAGGTKLHTTF